jgi:hypothetical protein
LPAQAGVSEEAALVFCQQQLVANSVGKRRFAGAVRFALADRVVSGPRATPADPGSPGSSQLLAGLG